MYGRIPYLNNSLSSWAIHRSDLRRLVYYIRVCSGMPLSVPLQTTQNDGINQEKLLVARNMQQCTKIRPRIPGMSTE